MSVSSSSFYDYATGVYTAGIGSLTLTGNTFSNTSPTGASSRYPALVTLNTLAFAHSGNTSSGNERHGFYTTGTVNSNQTLTASDLPYILQSASGFVVLAGKALTINPGAVFKFDTGANLNVSAGGILNVQGTSLSPVYFTSLNDQAADGQNTNNTSTAPLAGNWDAINLYAGASSTIANAVIRYGGQSGGQGADVYNNGGTLTVASSTVATSVTYGIYTGSGTSTVEFSDIHNQSTALYLGSGATGILNGSTVHDLSSTGIDNEGGGLTVVDSSIATTTTYGIYSGGNTEIRHSTIYNQTYGVYVASNGFTVRDSELHHQDHGIYINDVTPRAYIYNDHIHDDSVDGVHAKKDALIDVSELDHDIYGLFIDISGGNVTIESSNIHQNTDGIRIFADQAFHLEDITIASNGKGLGKPEIAGFALSCVHRCAVSLTSPS